MTADESLIEIEKKKTKEERVNNITKEPKNERSSIV